jgi:hypothetical protein
MDQVQGLALMDQVQGLALMRLPVLADAFGAVLHFGCAPLCGALCSLVPSRALLVRCADEAADYTMVFPRKDTPNARKAQVRGEAG